jgi:hypothetical protein
MGSKYLGQNTLLYVVDGLYGGGSNETRVPVKYFMPPFNNDWSNSIFMSQDQVALESVCYDFIRNEWNGTYQHNPANNDYESIPNVPGVDDYLHQAADKANWPENISYDPDNSGEPMASLGVHEHWNNAVKKQYSRNLGLSQGIELVAIPDSLVGGNQVGNFVPTSKFGGLANPTSTEKPERKEKQLNSGRGKAGAKTSVAIRSFDGAFKARNFYSVVVDDDNKKWFLTDAGLVSFNGQYWSLHDQNQKISPKNSMGLVFDWSSLGQTLWFNSGSGVSAALLPADANSGATSFTKQNSPILSNNLVSMTVGKGAIKGFGSDKGISALRGKKWLTGAYEEKYPEFMFKDYPIKAMATSPDGDSLYVATEGAGVTRVFRNDVDAISGASEYVQWGSIEIPSDKVYSVCITNDGTQWFGTDKGVARHIGYKTLEGWTAFDEKDGLIDNFVQAIAADPFGNVWFGTANGVSLFNGSSWTSFSKRDGLCSGNVQCIAVDKNGTVWMGTDQGVTSLQNNKFTQYK